jgi:hypothetical protein
MALTAANLTNQPQSFSIGPVKCQMLTFSVASADVSGTITVDGLSSIVGVQVAGITLTAAPTFSGNVITLAFVDPAATRYGSVIVLGK